jgi:PBP1b-binding outer membrane lipoprotein LpoB
MKNVLIIFTLTFLFASCGNETKPTPTEKENVEKQLEKDQAAMDSMEKVILEQIEEAKTDSINEPEN